MIRWLHISDLHIKDRADWNNFEQELWEKCKEFEKIDFVIVTGDFHNFWEKEDFHLAKEFLLELMKRLKLNIEKDLFLVPGNHDGVTNVKCKSAHIEALNRNPLDDEAPENFQALEEAFHDYEKFIKDMIPNYPVKHPAATHIRCWNDRINFVHCNTAIGADGKKKDMQLMNVDELAKNSLPREQTNIVLAHNSFDDIDERVQKRMQDWMRVNHVNAYLCGDRHRRELARRPEEKPFRTIPATCTGNPQRRSRGSYLPLCLRRENYQIPERRNLKNRTGRSRPQKRLAPPLRRWLSDRFRQAGQSDPEKQISGRVARITRAFPSRIFAFYSSYSKIAFCSVNE